MVTDHLGVVHTIDGVRLEAMMCESQVIVMIEDGPLRRPALIFDPDQAEKLGRALWDLGREE